MKKIFAASVNCALCSFLIVLKAYSQTTHPAIFAADARPSVFLQEGVSVPNDESCPTFTPDGKTVYISNNDAIAVSEWVKGKWTKPETISISGKFKDWDATLSPDGKKMIFVSNRPLDGMPQDKPQKSAHLWVSEHIGKQNWSAPKHIDAPVNEDGHNDYAPSISKKGSLCYCSRGRDGNKGMCAYYAKWLGDHYDKPQRLALNGENDIFDPYISPDESFIVFASEKVLFISYRNGDGWTQGEKLGPQINGGAQVGGPYVSPDGKMLYYSSAGASGIQMIPVNIR